MKRSKSIFKIFSWMVVLLLIGGCSSHIGLGYEKSYCEENGFDYSDAGFCGDPMKIYKLRKQLPRGCDGGIRE